jgi:uncharacterized membrane protein AbrB (regulator of aidB expression)
VHLDLLTSYLALSPGGLDSIAIIALNAPVNLPFVVAVQTARLFVVILLGPSIARFVAARLRNRQFNRAA